MLTLGLRLVAAPVSEPLLHGGARDGALAVCQRYFETPLLLADTSGPVADLEPNLWSGMLVVEWSPSQERVRGPGLAELVRAVPESPDRGSSWLLGRDRPFGPRTEGRAGGLTSEPQDQNAIRK
jgi:hypothetical protein